eukprot:g5508.t1
MPSKYDDNDYEEEDCEKDFEKEGKSGEVVEPSKVDLVEKPDVSNVGDEHSPGEKFKTTRSKEGTACWSNRDEMTICELYVLLHRVIITKFDDFFSKHLSKFSGNNDEEHRLEWTDMFKEFEGILEENFEEFAVEHGFEDTADLFSMIADTTLNNSRSSKFIKKIVRASTYKGDERFETDLQMQRFFTITSILLLVDCCVAGDFVASKESPWSGDLADTKCNVASVERANENQLADILDEIVNTQFFRLIRIDLKNNLCPFWKGEDEHEEEEDVMCENTIESTIFGSFEGEKESACSLSMDDTETPLLSIPRVPTTDDIDRTLTRVEVKHTSTKKIISDDPSMPGFWLDLLSNIWLNSSDYINLQLNPERWTGYDGSDVWSAMYDENCFSRLGGGVQKTDRLCYEERVMYRLLSGMHTATNVHINMKYFPPRRGVRTEWEPNPGRFMEQYGGKGQFIQNMHFAFVVLLRAAQRASPLLYNYNSPMLNDDQVAKTLLKRLLDSQILQSCSPVFEAFDESLLFNDEFHNITTLKRQFKGVFQNISSVLDCVTCEKCKMHAKVSVLGLGWALKTLLLPETMLVSALHEPEIVAFINTLHKFSHAIRHAKELSVMFATSQSGTNVPSHETISSASSNSILNKRAQSSDVAPSLPPSPSSSVPSNDDRETKLAPNVHEIDRIVGLIADSARRSLVDSG